MWSWLMTRKVCWTRWVLSRTLFLQSWREDTLQQGMNRYSNEYSDWGRCFLLTLKNKHRLNIRLQEFLRLRGTLDSVLQGFSELHGVSVEVCKSLNFPLFTIYRAMLPLVALKTMSLLLKESLKPWSFLSSKHNCLSVVKIYLPLTCGYTEL